MELFELGGAHSSSFLADSTQKLSSSCSTPELATYRVSTFQVFKPNGAAKSPASEWQRSPVLLYCDQPTQTKESQPQDISEDDIFYFPPIIEGTSTPLRLRPPPSPYFRYPRQPGTTITWTSEEEPEPLQPPQPHPAHRHQKPNKGSGSGLGRANILNRVPAQNSKVSDVLLCN